MARSQAARPESTRLRARIAASECTEPRLRGTTVLLHCSRPGLCNLVEPTTVAGSWSVDKRSTLQARVELGFVTITRTSGEEQ
jgi:hypothetical protein